ncbi:MAG: YbhB/YbcL family Raf kinase inhibitor-like protein, partial [Candidatus Latescibacteria bacterium]|nr:YbhB/YbcL family Raf kinase inhibitor-like protein [Candidatus Latescibacterota bacterium]
VLETLEGAVQGRGYGKHRYKGPKPPFKLIHRYIFTVYVLDCRIDLSCRSKKADLLERIEGHIIQKGSLSGKFQSRREE